MRSHQMYEEEMIGVGEGFPVWIGDPYGSPYEVEIGDIVQMW